MSGFIFYLFALGQLVIVFWALWLWYRRSAQAGFPIGLVALVSVYGNLIVALGARIGPGELLIALSWPRFYSLVFVVPLVVIAAQQITASAGIIWARRKVWRLAIRALVGALILYGLIFELLGRELLTICTDDVVRYGFYAKSHQICLTDQLLISPVGLPLAPIISNLVIFIFATTLLIKKNWPWMLIGSITLPLYSLLAPVAGSGFMVICGSSVVLNLSLVVSAARFSNSKK